MPRQAPPPPPHKRETVYVTRSQIHVDSAFNYRRHVGGNLVGLGASLDEFGQTQPMLVVPWPVAATPYSLRDGFRRMTAVDAGMAPVFIKRNTFELTVVTKPDGSQLSELEVQRICEATNSIRVNWTPMEEATLFRAEVQAAIAQASKSGSLSAGEERAVRAQTIHRLAELRGVSGRTIRYRLGLLELPDPLQDSIARGLVTTAAIQRIMDEATDSDHMVVLLREAAKESGVALDSDALPWDTQNAEPVLKRGGGGRSGPVTARAPRIQERAVINVLRRQGNPNVVVRPRVASDIKRELDRLTPLANSKDADTKQQARLALAWLRWFARQTDKVPV